MPCQYVEQYLKSDSRYVIVDPSPTGELHPQATCYVYVLCPRNVVLKLSIESETEDTCDRVCNPVCSRLVHLPLQSLVKSQIQ